MKLAATALSLGALFQPLAAQAAGPEPRILRPTSPWTLDFAEERCSLVREFADGDDKVRLQIDSYGLTGRGYRVMLVGDLIPGSDAAPLMELRPAYSPDARERGRFTLMAGKLDGQNAVSFTQGFLPESLPTGDPAEAAALRRGFENSITHLTLAFKLRKPFRLETGSMAEPFAAMHKCSDDLIASWGVDPAQFWQYSRHVEIADVPGGYARITPAALPRSTHPGPAQRRVAAMTQAVESYAARGGSPRPVRLMIDATGRPTECRVQVPVTAADQASACQTLAALSYQPALDAQGQPVKSFIQFNAN